MLVTRPLSQGTKASASCPSSAVVGDLVYVNGDQASGMYSVGLADPSQYAKMPAIAVVVAKLTSTSAVIQFRDEVRGIYSGLIPGRVYFVGANSRPTLTPPTPGVGRAYLQSIGVAVDQFILRLDPVKLLTTRTG